MGVGKIIPGPVNFVILFIDYGTAVHTLPGKCVPCLGPLSEKIPDFFHQGNAVGLFLQPLDIIQLFRLCHSGDVPAYSPVS